MIIELQNFGPIKSFKFDTSKDMHAIFGKNNIGKSYAISAVYLILKNILIYGATPKILSEDKNEIVGSSRFGDDINEKLKLYNINELDITEQLELKITDRINTSLLLSINKSFENTYVLKYLQNQSNTNDFKISIIDKFASLIIKLDNSKEKLMASKFELITKVIVIQRDFYSNFLEEHLKDKLEISETQIRFMNSFSNKLFINSSYSFTIIPDCIDYFLRDFLVGHSKIYFLPASRSGLYNSLNSFGAIFAEISRNRHSLTSKFEIPNLSEPISDYFLNLNTIDNAIVSETYIKDFEQIEKGILKGKVVFDNLTKKYFYTPTNTNMRLELSSTSSMISEIAPIIAHLKYIIPLHYKTPSILFIEEPEAHLHPEVQILLLEYFVKLSKGNLKIVMTSHSNYIFNKLSNLLIANKIDKDKLSVSLMKMTPEGSVIEEGAMQMDEYGIEDNNFVDVAEQLYEERMQLLENINS